MTTSAPKTPDGEPPEQVASDGAALQRRARFGAFAMFLRMAAGQLIVLGGDVYLRRRLEPADFGLFAIVQFALAFFAYFGDAGLGGALIQKKDLPTERELSSIWCLQLTLSLVVVVFVGLGAPYIVRFWPDMKPEGVWVIRALSLDLLLTAARAVPGLLMERDLLYGRLSILELILSAAFYVSAALLAHFGFGVMSLVGAVLIQGSCGVIGAFSMRPWRPSLVIDMQALRPILRFGAAYQTKNIIGFLSSAITPVYAGRVLGQTQLGFINWAQTTAFFPLKLVEVMGRVTFPLYSRLQTERELFARSLERSIQLCAMGTLFFVGLGFGIGPRIVSVVFSDKWMPALPYFYVYAAGISLGFLAPLIAPALDALGRPQIIARFSIGWTTAICVLVAFMTPRWGALGFVIGYCIPMVVGNVGVILVVKTLLPSARLWPRARASLAGGLVVALAGRYLFMPFVHGPASFVLAVLLEAVVFLAIVFLVDRSALEDALALVRKNKG